MQLLPHGAQDLPTAGRRVSRLTPHRFKMGGAWHTEGKGRLTEDGDGRASEKDRLA
jgi:hypothetical protein